MRILVREPGLLLWYHAVTPFIAQNLLPLESGSWGVSASMALLHPIPGVAGRVFAADERTALDEKVLDLLEVSVIINLTRHQSPGCTLTSISLSQC